MKYFTQSNVTPGNCWQTAIACILDVEPDTLPPQDEIEAWGSYKLGGWSSYSNVLNGYLRKHHALMYAEVDRWKFSLVRPVRSEFVMCGPTVRTAEHGRHHCVVASNGVQVWDPHPSRAGLTEVHSWGVLGALNSEWVRSCADRRADDRMYQLVFGCLCPSCGLSEARELVTSQPDATTSKRIG